MAWLELEIESRDSTYRERVRFAGRTVTIGRDEECDLTVGHSVVSGVHARIVRVRGRLRAEDAGSRHGLLLNRMPISTAGVHEGDVLSLGRGGPKVRLIDFDVAPGFILRIVLSLPALLCAAFAATVAFRVWGPEFPYERVTAPIQWCRSALQYVAPDALPDPATRLMVFRGLLVFYGLLVGILLQRPVRRLIPLVALAGLHALAILAL